MAACTGPSFTAADTPPDATDDAGGNAGLDEAAAADADMAPDGGGIIVIHGTRPDASKDGAPGDATNGADAPPEGAPNLMGDASSEGGEGGSVVACGNGMKRCGATCVSTTDPNNGCGSDVACDRSICPDAHGGTLTCQAGACVIGACGAGFKKCGDACVPTGDPAFGCGATTCDSSACPAPGTGTLMCQGGACVIGTCGAGTKKCGGKCVAVDDPTYGCGPTTCDTTPCPSAGTGTLTCQGGACVIGTCGAGTKKCGSACVPTDRNNGCGDPARCTACAASETCVGSPSTSCTCVPDNVAACKNTTCGMATNNCGATVVCGAGSKRCSGNQPQTCSASGAWQSDGAACTGCSTCSTATGQCAPATGTTCSDGNACTQGDTCNSGVCTPGPAVTCPSGDQCHIAGQCAPATGVCPAPLPAPSTTPCTSSHATSATCDGAGNCKAVTCANGYVNDVGTCKLPNCMNAACGASDGAGGICTGSNGTCPFGQRCNASGQCICDATSCPTGCCDAVVNGNCKPGDVDSACGTGGTMCQICSQMILANTCYLGLCRGIKSAACSTDADCVPGGCFNNLCLGTIGIAGEVSCGVPAAVCGAEGCWNVGLGASPDPGTCSATPDPGAHVVVACDGPNDCASSEDCCSSFDLGANFLAKCYPRVNAVVGSGCAPTMNAGSALVCDPRNPVCPSGGACSYSSPVYNCR